MIEEVKDDDEACKREIYWINYYKSYIGFINSNGYCEARGELHSGRTVIALYLHKEEAIKFLKDIFPIYGEDKEIINCLKDYFDKEDTITGLFRYSFVKNKRPIL